MAPENDFKKQNVGGAVLRADALADVAPENSELMPSLGPQTYPKVPALYFPGTAEFSPGRRADAIISVIEKAKEQNMTAAGFFETSYSSGTGINSKVL